MTNNKKWYIRDVKLTDRAGSIRMSGIKILDSEGNGICNIRTYSQPIARKIVDSVNGYDELRLEVEQLKSKLRQCEIIANNVLYFDDNSDYVTALWQVLNVTQGRKADDDCYDVKYDIKLAYIEEEL